MNRAPILSSGLLLALCVAVALPVVAQDEPEFVTEQAAGVIDATDYSRLEILGLYGAVSVRAGLPGDLRFSCRDLASRREERAVALWIDGRTLILGPGEGLEEERLLCEAVVPPHLSVIVELDDGKVVVNNLANDIEISGSSVDVEARALAASIEVNVDDGKVRLYGVAEDVTIEGKDIDLLARDIEGYLSVTLAGGKANISNVKGDLTAELENVVFAIESVEGAGEISAEGGELVVTGLLGGGNVVLSGTRLNMSASKGPFDIDTDTDIELREMAGDMRLRAERGKVGALGSAGNVHIDAAEAEVTVERVAGKTTIIGDQLRLQLRELKGDLDVQTSGSQVVVAGVDGAAMIQNDYGDVVVAKAKHTVTIKNVQGSVRVTQLAGPLQLESDGPEVTVHWIDSSHGKPSSLTNKSGNMTVMFSQKGGGRIEARSLHGTVQAQFVGVEVAEDGKSASGHVNRMAKPIVKLVAEGDLFLNEGPRGAADQKGGRPGARGQQQGKKSDQKRDQ